MNDLLSDHLHEATQDLPARLRSGPAVRAVATRRRQRRRVLAGAAAAVAVGVVATSVQVENNADRLMPAGSTSQPPSVSPPVKPAPVPTTARPQTPAPTVVSPPTAAPTGPSPLAGFHFKEEAVWRTGGEATVSRSNDRLTAWALDPCLPTDYPTDSQRVAMASLTRTAPESGEVRQLAVYPDAAAAAEVMAGFRRVLAACARRDDPAGTGIFSRFVTSPLKIADEGLVTVQSSIFPPANVVPGGSYNVLVRDGRSVYLAVIGREFQPKGPSDAAATELVAAARKQLPLPQ